MLLWRLYNGEELLSISIWCSLPPCGHWQCTDGHFLVFYFERKNRFHLGDLKMCQSSSLREFANKERRFLFASKVTITFFQKGYFWTCYLLVFFGCPPGACRSSQARDWTCDAAVTQLQQWQCWILNTLSRQGTPELLELRNNQSVLAFKFVHITCNIFIPCWYVVYQAKKVCPRRSFIYFPGRCIFNSMAIDPSVGSLSFW